MIMKTVCYVSLSCIAHRGDRECSVAFESLTGKIFDGSPRPFEESLFIDDFCLVRSVEEEFSWSMGLTWICLLPFLMANIRYIISVALSMVL